MSAVEDSAVSQTEAQSLFTDLAAAPALVLAISGGPDSTALLFLVARWRKRLKAGPRLIAVTVDHGLRPEAKREAAAVKRLARSLKIEHRTLRWTGRKPATGLQEAARDARYRLLADVATQAGARHVLTAHTLDDQAETVLIRLARGSGVSGLAAMARVAPLPGCADRQIALVRPLLGIPKSRLLATLRAAKLGYADDASNRDPRFTRVRLRELMSALGREGLTPPRLAALARRVRRAEAALESAVDRAADDLAPGAWRDGAPVILPARPFFCLPAELALRLLGRAVARTGDEGPVELGKLESLHAALAENAGAARFRRTLAGAVVTLAKGHLSIERAPTRRGSGPRSRGS